MTYPILSQHSEWCRAAGYSETTIVDRRELLMRVATDLGPLLQATADQLTKWLGRPGWHVQTRATYFGHLHAFYLWALRSDLIDRDPMLNMKRPRTPKGTPRPARLEHYERIMAEATQRWRIAAALAARAGFRACEIARACREDVDPDDIRVLGKGGRVDMIPTHPVIWALVEPLPPGPLITDSRGQPYRPSSLSTQFSEAATRLGMKELTLHPLRHLYGTTLLRDREDGGAGANLRVVQELMRHRSPATTAIYTEVTDRERRRAIQTLSAAA